MLEPAPLVFPSRQGPGMHCISLGFGAAQSRGERLLGKRVFIVEDEALLALELEMVFSDEGAEVIGPALSLSHGFMLVESTSEIDCAVLDVDLGGREVFPIAHALAARGVPFIFHTAHATAKALQALFPESGMIPKPARPEEIVERLAAIAH